MGQKILDEIQDSLSEVKRGERVGAKRKHGAPIKHTGLSMGLEHEEKLMSGKNTWGEIGRKEKEKEKKKDQSVEVSRRRNLYLPLDEFKRLALSSSESDEGLSSSEETDLEEEAVHYKGERYQQDKKRATQSRKRQKAAGESPLAARPPDCRLQGPRGTIQNLMCRGTLQSLMCRGIIQIHSFQKRNREKCSKRSQFLKELREGVITLRESIYRLRSSQKQFAIMESALISL